MDRLTDQFICNIKTTFIKTTGNFKTRVSFVIRKFYTYRNVYEYV